MSGSREQGQEALVEQVLLETSGDVAVLRLGSDSERVVTLTEKRIVSFVAALEEVKRSPTVKLLIITGATASLFCAGADIHAIRSITDAATAERLAAKGQEVFSLLESLSCTTVAAIAGACVGGGCELVLACNYRVALDSPETRIGLPEIKLGILPGFGGTQRLPRLIGLPAALDIILKAKVLPARKALEVGLLDAVVPATGGDADWKALELAAINLARNPSSSSRRGPNMRDSFLTRSALGRWLVERQVRPELLRQTHGQYPAPPRALECVLYGLKHGATKGYKAEARALGELLVTPESKSLVHVYLLTEEATKRWKGVRSGLRDLHVCVIGAGTMGAGIAAALLATDVRVTVIDSSAEARERAKQHIENAVTKRAGANASKLLAQLHLAESLASASDAHVVIEAIFENLEVKTKLFNDLSAIVDSKAILASNTSSLPISSFGADISSPGRVIGMHFFNPAEKMPLVEVVCAPQSDERTIAYTAALAVKMGKFPVVVKEVPGFLVNRILSPYLTESAHALSDGFSVADVDRAATDFGMPMGPLRLLDEVGLDVAAHVAQIMSASYGSRMTGPNYAKQLADRGLLGKKKGEGFYRHEGRSSTPNTGILSILGLATPRFASSVELAELGERLSLSLVNEAVRCFDEAVAGMPGPDAAGQIDLGTVMGIGFAPFRGGVMHYAESIGPEVLLRKLSTLRERFGDRFEPAEGIRQRARSGIKSFIAGAYP